MIVLDKDRILEDYFIDEKAVITDKNGNVQKQGLRKNGRYYFKQQLVHKIMLNTFCGWRDSNWVVHHVDWNPKNNKLENLVYLTRAEHQRVHHKGKVGFWKGKHLSEETRQKISAATKGEKNHNYGKPSRKKGKKISIETKAKISAATKGINNWSKKHKWFNNGIKEIRAKECPQGFVAGRIKR